MAVLSADGRQTRLAFALRRLIPLALLGSAIGLAAVHLVTALRHEIDLRLDLSAEWSRELVRVEMSVLDEDGRCASVTVFHFDDEHPPRAPLRHKLELVRGRYDLQLKLFRSTSTVPVVVKRELVVVGGSEIRYAIP
ncbi:MAG: hypothetical protein JXR96_00845 [Deltaproteobacteria bacterium]|nr:hypothetical protein [Deltaproteobacteria bacterium]